MDGFEMESILEVVKSVVVAVTGGMDGIQIDSMLEVVKSIILGILEIIGLGL
jgi:hypothetical protein